MKSILIAIRQQYFTRREYWDFGKKTENMRGRR